MNQNSLVLKRKQLDRQLSPFRQVGIPEVPRDGWTKAIRTALRMPAEILGKRLGISQSAVHQLETSEAAETITLSSLKKLAGGLECELVYAIVPKASLEDIMQQQALRRAQALVDATSVSMELENQSISQEEQRRQIEAAARDLLVNPSTGFWSEP